MNRRALAPLLAAAALLPLGGSPDAADATAARPSGYRIVLASDLDRDTRAYTIRPDGSGLTPLLSPDRQLIPFDVSRDGRTVAYYRLRLSAIYISRGNGTRLRWVTAATYGTAALSPDGRMVAYTFGSSGRLAVIGTNGRGRRVLASGPAEGIDWSPDGKVLVYAARNGNRASVVIQPLRGRRRVLARNANAPTWSPDGRWIAYGSSSGMWLVRPDGRGRHRVGLGGLFSWSPDSRRLAVGSGRDIRLVGRDGRVSRRMRLPGQQEISKLLWAPDGRSLLVERYPPNQIWIVGLDGKGLRRVTRLGNSSLVGWTRLSPAHRPLPSLLPSERVTGPRTVATRSPIAALSADGARVAFALESTAADCGHAAVWSPATRALARRGRPAPCRDWPPRSAVYDVELAGDRLAWGSQTDCGNTCKNTLDSGNVGAQSRNRLALEGSDVGSPSDFHVHGDGDLLVFNDGPRLARVGSGSEPCQEEGPSSAAICTTLRRGDHAAVVDSVSGRLIAVREEGAAAVLDERGELVRLFQFAAGEVTTVRLDGGRLVVTRGDLIDVYDVSTGARTQQRPLPRGFGLVDVDGGVAVLLTEKAVMLLRLEDGRSRTLTPGRGPVHADLEPAGLYYSFGTTDGGGRVVFVPRSEAEPAARVGR